jgi:hypothetical protein
VSDSDESWDREKDIGQYFDPESVESWLQHYSPGEFLAVMINEIRREQITIEGYAKLLDDSPVLQATTLNINEQLLSVQFCTQTILQATRILNRLLDTAAAYRAASIQSGQDNS